MRIPRIERFASSVLCVVGLAACGGESDPPTTPAKTLSVTLAPVAPQTAALSTVSIAGEVSGSARVDSVVLTYQAQRHVLLEARFRTELLATQVGPATVRVDAFSSEAATVSATSSHQVTASDAAAPVLAFFDRLAASQRVLRQQLLDALPRNPGNAEYLQQKLRIVGDAGMLAAMAAAGRYHWVTAAHGNGDPLQVVLGFPEESMRAEAAAALQRALAVLPHLEELLQRRFPHDAVHIQYGFVVGSSGGGGMLSLEDRGTYDARWRTGMMGFQQIIPHELGHSYMGHERITQYIELYGHNRANGHSADPASWTETRGWVPGLATNSGLHAILDIADLVGPEAMSRILLRLHLLGPPYGTSLSAAGQAIFVEESPAEHRPAVAALAARIGA